MYSNYLFQQYKFANDYWLFSVRTNKKEEVSNMHNSYFVLARKYLFEPFAQEIQAHL